MHLHVQFWSLSCRLRNAAASNHTNFPLNPSAAVNPRNGNTSSSAKPHSLARSLARSTSGCAHLIPSLSRKSLRALRCALRPHQTTPYPPSPPDCRAQQSLATAPMLVPFFLALLLPCAGMSSVFVVYICLLWYSANNGNQAEFQSPVKPVLKKGLSKSELEKLPKVIGNELIMGAECAVCLDGIESDQPVRLIPGCNHGFHVQCADTWLSKHPVCPVCRNKLDPQMLNPPDNPC